MRRRDSRETPNNLIPIFFLSNRGCVIRWSRSAKMWLWIWLHVADLLIFSNNSFSSPCCMSIRGWAGNVSISNCMADWLKVVHRDRRRNISDIFIFFFICKSILVLGPFYIILLLFFSSCPSVPIIGTER